MVNKFNNINRNVNKVNLPIFDILLICFYYYYKESGITTIYDYKISENITYMSGWFTALNNLGIIGFLTYLYFFIPKIFNRRNTAGMFGFFLFTALMFGTSIYEKPIYFLALYLITTNTLNYEEYDSLDDN